MRRLLLILTAAFAALLLPGCSSREVLVTKAVDLELKIESVTGTKVIFSIKPDNEDATYIFCCILEDQPQFEQTDKEVAEDYIAYLEAMTEQMPRGQEQIGSFSDFGCYRGTRKLKIEHLTSDKTFRLLLFQVNPKTHAVIGKISSEIFHTKAVTMSQMDFYFASKQNTLVITPSDMEHTYFWSFDRSERISDDHGSPYFFLYSLLDVYEEYGFAEHVLSKGTVQYDFPADQLWEGEEYCACAVGYENGEITSEESVWYFIYEKGAIIPVQF